MVDGWTSLASYVDRMPEDQKAVYYISGSDEKTLRQSPLLEAYRKKGYEVLLMTDEIDDFVTPMMGPYKEKELKAVNRSGSAEDLESEDDKKKAKDAEPVLKVIKETLGEAVKDVRSSVRLLESPSCIVTDDADPTAQMAQIMKAMGQGEGPEVKFILEVNPDHDIVTKLGDSKDKELNEDVSWMLYEQALLQEGVPLKDPAAFNARLNRLMSRGFDGSSAG